MKNPESNRIAEVGLQGCSMTWGESLQCPMVWVGVSQCPTGGWRKRQGTTIYHLWSVGVCTYAGLVCWGYIVCILYRYAEVVVCGMYFVSSVYCVCAAYTWTALLWFIYIGKTVYSIYVLYMYSIVPR
jgi:hypothetical protein